MLPTPPATRPKDLSSSPYMPKIGNRHIWWNFVSSSKARIEQAKNDWRQGDFEPVPGETEFIPLPD
jgi:hypothetical protein